MLKITQSIPDVLTSYDLLKAFAIITMIVDHIGAYFYPDEMMFRAIGRWGVPIWFFLIGYSERDTVPLRWFVGIALLSLGQFALGSPILPLTILATLALARGLKPVLVEHAMVSCKAMLSLFLVLWLLSFHTSAVAEYGSAGFIIVLMGVVQRNYNEISLTLWQRLGFMVAAASFYALQQLVLLGGEIPVLDFMIMISGIYAVFLVLFFFRATEIQLGMMTAWPVRRVFQVLGRWTLEIYVTHLLIFRFLSPYVLGEPIQWFRFKLMANEFASLFY